MVSSAIRIDQPLYLTANRKNKRVQKAIGYKVAKYAYTAEVQFFPRKKDWTKLAKEPDTRPEILALLENHFKNLFSLNDLTHLMTCLEPMKVIPGNMLANGIQSGIKGYDCYLGNFEQLRLILAYAAHMAAPDYLKNYFGASRNIENYLEMFDELNSNNVPIEIHYGYGFNPQGEVQALHKFKWKIPDLNRNYPTPCYERFSAITQVFGGDFLLEKLAYRNLLSSYWTYGLESQNL